MTQVHVTVHVLNAYQGGKIKVVYHKITLSERSGLTIKFHLFAI